MEIREYYATHKNYRDRKSFDLRDSMLGKSVSIQYIAPTKKIDKERFGGLKENKNFNGNKKGARKPLFYPTEIDQKILVWVLEMMDLHLPISSLALSKLAKSRI